MADVRTYHRGFQRIGRWLKNKTKISEKSMNEAFWNGLPRSLQPRLEASLEEIFQRDHFDVEASDSELENDQDDSDSSDLDSSSSDSDSESDDEIRVKKSSKSTKKFSHKKSKQERHSWKCKLAKRGLTARQHLQALREEEEEEEGKTTRNQDKVEVLIKCMQNISIDDSSYAALYYRVFKLDKDIFMVVKQPNAWDNSSQDAQSWPNNIPLGAGAQTRASACPKLTYYGCKNKEHTMNNCLKVNELINKGIIKRDNNEKLIMGDGTLIIRAQNESIVSAVQKLTVTARKPQSNYVAYSLNSNFYPSNSDSNDEIFVLPAEQTPKVSKDTRKARFEGVFPPSLSDWALHAPTFDPNNDDTIMEDIEAAPRHKPSKSPIVKSHLPAPPADKAKQFTPLQF
ncbi:hypothetical protein BKA93DRAFT_747336 [Sparassis latifolia]